MTNSVTFSPSVGGDGSTVTDDSNPATGLAGGYHRIHFVPALSQTVAVAANTVTQATNAAASAVSAANSAAAAAVAVGTTSTSTTSNSVSIASKTFTTQAGKAYVIGMYVVVASTGTPANTMFGNITAYNSGTGSLTVNVIQITGSGTNTDWSISLSAPARQYPNPTGNAGKFLTTPDGVTETWVAIPSGITSASAITTSTTLTVSSAGYQATAMTVMGQSVTLPDATTLSVGSPKYIIDNTKGGYPVGIRDTSGTLLMGVAAGGEAIVSLRDNSSASGIWSVTGTNMEPGLITIDSTFSSTYASTVLAPFVALDNNKSIHFAALSSGFAAFAVDNTTGAVGTPVTVSATASMVPRSCFMITSTTAAVFYSSTTGTLIGVVISLSGATALSIGTPSSTLTDTGVGVEDFISAPKIAQLSTTSYVVSWATATGAGNTSVAAFQVTAGTTITLGATVNIIAANNIINSTTTYPLTSTTALVLYKSGAAAPYANNAVVISVSGTTCTVGTPAALTGVTSSGTSAPASCALVVGSKYLVADDNNVVGTYKASVFSVTAGTTVTAGTSVSVETGGGFSITYIANSATRYNSHLFGLTATTALLWYFDTGPNGLSRCVVLSESAGVVTKGTIVYGSISSSNTTGNGAISAQGASNFLAYIADDPNATSAKLKAHKISGTTITTGQVASVLGMPIGSYGAYQPSTRLASGDYVYGICSSTGPTNSIPVIRTNGDTVNFRGRINCPSLSNAKAVVPVVASNRLVLLGGTDLDSSTISTSTYQLRLLNVEIAA